MVFNGHIVNGAIVLDEAVVLPEGATVHVALVDETKPRPKDGAIPTLLERLQGIVGTIDDLPEDSSTNLDHYLYGTPKR